MRVVKYNQRCLLGYIVHHARALPEHSSPLALFLFQQQMLQHTSTKQRYKNGATPIRDGLKASEVTKSVSGKREKASIQRPGMAKL